MTTKKTSVTRKQKAIIQSVKDKEVEQVNPVVRKVQTQEGWKRSQLKIKAQKKR